MARIVLFVALSACASWELGSAATDAGTFDAGPQDSAPLEDGARLDASADAVPIRDPLSCLAIKAANPSAASGEYVLGVTTADASTKRFTAHCEMDFDGGGWILFQRWVGKARTGPIDLANTRGPSEVRLNQAEAAFLYPEVVQALAARATAVHIRSPSAGAPTRYITSKVVEGGSLPITNLRNLRVLNANTGFGEQTQHWSGTMVPQLVFTCAPTHPNYPNLYHSCGNGLGFNITGDSATWVFDAGNEPLEVYLR